MKTSYFGALVLVLSPVIAAAETPKLPKDAVQLNGAQIAEWLDGKKFKSVVIYDASVPTTATTNWDLAKNRVFGTYDAGGKKGKFEGEWIIQGDSSCGERTSSGKLICQKIFVVGDVMYEVNKKGKVHAISKP